MNILIVGKSGLGKSKLGDIVRHTIFRMDEDSTIRSSDPDREMKSFGEGKNVYNIEVKQLPDKDGDVLTKEDLASSDIVIILASDKFKKWYKEVYS